MAYDDLTTVADIERYYPGVIEFTHKSTPSISDIEFWIKEGSAIVYSVVRKKYTVPITEANDLLILNAYCRKYVMAHIQFTLTRTTAAVSKNGVMVPREVRLNSFYDSLALLESGDLELESPKISTIIGISYNQENDIKPFSKKEEDQY